MWHKWVARSIGGIAFVFLVLLVVANLMEVVRGSGTDYNGYYARDYHHGVLSGWFAQTIADASSYWSAIASLVGIIAITFLYEQLVATNAATNETKRSVDAFIQTERARILVYEVREEKIENQNSLLHFTIVNLGRGYGTITGEWTSVDFLTRPITEIPEIDRSVKLSDIIVPMPPGHRIETHNGYILGKETRKALQMPKQTNDATHMIFRIVIRYETAYDKVYLCGTTWVGTVATGRIQRVHDGYTFDIPWHNPKVKGQSA